MASDAVTVEQSGAVAVVHIDDGKANALGPAVLAAIQAAVLAAEADQSTSAVVLHGRPGVFSGGFDLNVMKAGDMSAVTSMVSGGGELVRTCYGAGIPVVAACTGHAVAAGALVLLGCDLRIGRDTNARIGLPEVNIQMVLPHWALTIAKDRLSRRHLQQAVVHGKMYESQSAVDAGFLDEVVPATDVLDTAIAQAAAIIEPMHLPSYAGSVERLRGEVLATMDAQIAADRAG